MILSTVKQYISRLIGKKEVETVVALEIADTDKCIDLGDGDYLKHINVKSSHPWTVSSYSDWIRCRIRESSLEILISANTSDQLRTDSIKIENTGGKSQLIYIRQRPSKAKLEVISFDSEAWLNYHETKYEFFVSSAGNWSIDCDSSWISVFPRKGQGSRAVKVKLEANNNSKNLRRATICIADGNSKIEHNIIQRGKKSFDDATHYFYVHKATLPILYSGISILSNDKPSYLLDYRNTFNQNLLPPNVNVIAKDGALQNIINTIRSIEKENPDAVYAYFTDDMRVIAAFEIFSRLGIDSSRIKISMITDGTSTYKDYIRLFSPKVIGAFRYALYRRRTKKMLANYNSNPTYGTLATDKNDDINQDTFYTHLFSRQDNVRHYIVSTDYLISNSKYLKKQISRTNYITISPRDMLAQLSDEKQDIFYRMAGFDFQTNADLLNDSSSKKNLIIIGTTTTAWSPVDVSMQEQYIQTVMDRYGSEYNIFLKAHPEDERTDYEQRFPGLRLIQPKTMPFDLFVWALNDRIDAFGGFVGTVFINLPTDKVRFMFARDAHSLGNLLYYTLFKDKNIDWITID